MYMDDQELDGVDIWDKIRMRRRAQPMPVAPDEAVYAQGAGAATQPRAPAPVGPPRIDDSQRPPPPAVPPPVGKRDWWMNKKAPPQWQRGDDRTPDRWDGTDRGLNPHSDPREQRRLLEGAYRAGRNGDAGAADGFPPTPFGRKLRAEYERGRRDAQRQQARR